MPRPPYREVSSPDVVVDRCRGTYYPDPVFPLKVVGSAEAAVATENHQAVYLPTLEVFRRLFPAWCGSELFTSGRVEYCAAPLKNVAYVGGLHFNEFIFDQTLIASFYSEHGKATGDCGSHRGPYPCVHSRSVTAAGKNSYRLQRSLLSALGGRVHKLEDHCFSCIAMPGAELDYPGVAAGSVGVPGTKFIEHLLHSA